jgi:hypothetical protein
MLTMLHHTTNVPPHPFPTLEVLLAEPFPHTPQDRMQLEQRLSTAATQPAPQILRVQVTCAHEDEAFVRQAIAPSASAACGSPGAQGLAYHQGVTPWGDPPPH